MNFKEYKKAKLEEYKAFPWFDEDSNGVFSTSNRTFLQQIAYGFAQFRLAKLGQAVTDVMLGTVSLLVLVTSPISVPLGIVFFAVKRKIKCNKEVYREYQAHLKHISSTGIERS